VFPYTLMVRLEAFTGTWAAYLCKNGRFTSSYCAHYREFPYKAAPIRFFKFVWGLPAGAEDPKNEVVDNLPRYAG
jgi:hypothetical protein